MIRLAHLFLVQVQSWPMLLIGPIFTYSEISRSIFTNIQHLSEVEIQILKNSRAQRPQSRPFRESCFIKQKFLV
jgi:hypothetical protein